MNEQTNIHDDEFCVGVVGLGLMGSSIVTDLLLADYKVVGLAPISDDLSTAPECIQQQLDHCEKSGLLSRSRDYYSSRLTISEDYMLLGDCRLVLECVIEQTDIKESVYKKITDKVSVDTVIATNTSAIPISFLQKYVDHPERFLGVHWAEPAYMTRFLEITCGELTWPKYAEWVFEITQGFGKDPTLLRKDIRGFVTNRLMYAVYREMFHIVEKGEASMEDVDKAFRYDAGSWMTLMGIFRRMDFAGLTDYPEIFKNIFPKLSNTDKVPELMQKMISSKAKGIQDANGLFAYTREEAMQWDKAFAQFNQDIYKLAMLYPSEPRS